MFLNDIGQPLILNSKKTYGPYEQVSQINKLIEIINNILIYKLA